MIHDLLSRGYFPQELPPPFCTTSFADFVRDKGVTTFVTTNRKSSKLVAFNLARAGSLRRELGIPNPVHFSFLADCLSQNWLSLQKKFNSRFSLTTPSKSSSGRALSRLNELDDLPEQRASQRAKGKFVLSADVARFYPSIYTHSIAWAIHGKAKAKSKSHRFDKTALGNQLDALVRNCQDEQTMGIPVGPDTSLVIAELILAQVDRTLVTRKLQGFRYIDDYELIFESEYEALKGRAILQQALLNMELNLGPAKTRITRLPMSLREPWIAELRRFPLRRDWQFNFRKILLAFFDRAFELSSKNPDQGVLKYAAGRVSKLWLPPQEAVLAENLLMQCARVEAGALAYALAAILRYPQNDNARLLARKNFLNSIIEEHAPQRHSSEVAWALWAQLVLGYSIERKLVSKLVTMDDPVCSLLALHAREKNLIAAPKHLDELRKGLDLESLYGPKWLLAYEACRKGWFRFRGSNDYVAADINFSQLRKNKVSFYERKFTTLKSPSPSNSHGPNPFHDEVDEYISRIVRRYDEDDWYDDPSNDDDDDEDENASSIFAPHRDT